MDDSDLIIDLDSLTLGILARAAHACLAWCIPRSDGLGAGGKYSHYLRSEELRDEAHAVFPNSCHTPFTPGMLSAFANYRSKRMSLCASAVSDLPRSEVLVELTRLRSLLITDWSSSLFDGTADCETGGFIDENGMPAWDTWVALIHVRRNERNHTGLLSWVPRNLAPLVDSAIVTDAASSFSWLQATENIVELRGWGETCATQ